MGRFTNEERQVVVAAVMAEAEACQLSLKDEANYDLLFDRVTTRMGRRNQHMPAWARRAIENLLTAGEQYEALAELQAPEPVMAEAPAASQLPSSYNEILHLKEHISSEVGALADLVIEVVRGKIPALNEENPARPVEEVSQTKATRKLLLLGLLPEQVLAARNQELILGFKVDDLYQVKGVKTPNKKVDALVAWADDIVIFTKFTDHGTQEKLPKDKTLLHHGGVSSVQVTLQKFLLRQMDVRALS